MLSVLTRSKKTRKQSKILLLEIIICLVPAAASIYAGYYIYAGAYNTNFAASSFICWVLATLFNWKKEVQTPSPRFRWFTFVLIVFVFVTFLVTKPSYTYEQGKTYLESRNYTAVELLEPRSLISFNLERNYFITSAYLYTGRKNGHDYYLLLQPKTGEFESLKVNSGNYIDHYFEMLDSMSAH